MWLLENAVKCPQTAKRGIVRHSIDADAVLTFVNNLKMRATTDDRLHTGVAAYDWSPCARRRRNGREYDACLAQSHHVGSPANSEFTGASEKNWGWGTCFLAIRRDFFLQRAALRSWQQSRSTAKTQQQHLRRTEAIWQKQRRSPRKFWLSVPR